MTNPLDELKELEARRAAAFIGNQFKSPQRLFDESHGTIYRRLALEVARDMVKLIIANTILQQQLKEAEAAPIIFSPSDPRVRVGEVYEFGSRFNFNNGGYGVTEDGDRIIGTLIDVSDSDKPFCCRDAEGNIWGQFVFLRELPKEERG